jgi:hypothetical protein
LAHHGRRTAMARIAVRDTGRGHHDTGRPAVAAGGEASVPPECPVCRTKCGAYRCAVMTILDPSPVSRFAVGVAAGGKARAEGVYYELDWHLARRARATPGVNTAVVHKASGVSSFFRGCV